MTIRHSVLMFIAVSLLFGCGGINRNPYADTPTTGIISIGVDETFKPITEAELMVFGGIYQYAKITPVYTTEENCVQMLLDDSVRLIITYRPLYENEKVSFRNRQIIPRELKIATDAIAVIIHPENADTLLSMNELKGILTGEIKQWAQINQKSSLGNIDVIFDNKKSSILQFVLDSICRTSNLSKHSYALDSTIDVVNYVADHRNAIGFIGVSLVSDSDDSTQMSFLNRIRVVALSKSDQPAVENSYKPYQAYIFQGLYPLTRDVYAINAEPRNGLATGFMSFLASDRGQRIILKSGIVPSVAPIRIVNVRENL
ncbi:MAG: substrate-binding domain-containing protein [Bacteroidales bacterium]|nr:substrate-binding domain-containing protein [Bacteroidales bacterium]